LFPVSSYYSASMDTPSLERDLIFAQLHHPERCSYRRVRYNLGKTWQFSRFVAQISSGLIKPY
jgi:hypothetical protein